MSYVLVPGAGGSAWYWHRVVSELSSRDRGAVAVQLPADDDEAGFPEYADAVVEAVGHNGKVIVVAQSMGGFTAPLLFDRLNVALLVFLNAMIPASGETGGEWWDATGQEAAKRELDLREGRDPDAEWDEQVLFMHDVPEAMWPEALENNVEQSMTPFGQSTLDGDWPADVPLRVVAARGDRLFPVDFQRRVARERLGIEADEVPGGHLCALSQPVALVERLEAYRAEIGLG